MTKQPQRLTTREQLATFVDELAAECGREGDGWANSDLPRYLEALSALITDMEGYYANRGEMMPTQPSWSTLSELLSAARFYE